MEFVQIVTDNRPDEADAIVVDNARRGMKGILADWNIEAWGGATYVDLYFYSGLTHEEKQDKLNDVLDDLQGSVVERR
jgi:hypothetical protein